MTAKVRASSKLKLRLEDGEKLTMEVTDKLRTDFKLEFVADHTLVGGQTTTYKAKSICVRGWTRPGPEHIPKLSIYMDCDKNREFRILEESSGALGTWLKDCCDFSYTKAAFYTPKYID